MQIRKYQIQWRGRRPKASSPHNPVWTDFQEIEAIDKHHAEALVEERNQASDLFEFRLAPDVESTISLLAKKRSSSASTEA
jgi:hypothetical protein